MERTMNKLEALECDILELQLQKDVMVETVILEKERNNLRSYLRDMGSLYDAESFRIDVNNVLKSVATAFVVIGSLLMDALDSFLDWCDNMNKGDLK